MSRRHLLCSAAVVAVTFVPVAGANPVSSQYNAPTIAPPVTQVAGTSAPAKQTAVTTTQPSQTTQPSSTATLPYTGLNLILFVVIGSVALASGLGLRKLAARRRLDR